MAIKKDTLDQLLDGRDPKEVFNKDGLFDELKKALAERVLNAELDDHLESEAPAGRRNHRNGHSKKTVRTETAKLDIRIPRDREGTFDPKLIARYQRRFPGFDEKIVSMYARGMTTREFQGHLMELYGLEVSPDLISTVTDAVLETVAEWQNRPLEASYPLVFFDAMRVKIRDEGMVRNKPQAENILRAVCLDAQGDADRCSGGRSKSAATSPMTKPRQNSSIWSCVRRRRNGKCRRVNGARRKPSSPSCSKTGSSWHDGQPAPHRIFS